MRELMLALMTWLAPVTGLPAAGDLPDIRMADQCAIERMYIGDGTHECSGSVVAIYDNTKERIYLKEDWRPDDLYSVSVLLHELVHHMQHKSGRSYPCERAKEAEAYDAQIKWLEASGVDAMELMEVNELFVRLISLCESHY